MRRSTVVFLVLFVVALSAYYILKNRKEAEPVDILITPEPTTQVSFLFDATEGIPTDIKIESKAGDVVEIAHNADNLWVVVLPTEASADQGYAEAAASQLTTIMIQNKVQNVDLDTLGLKTPEYVLTVKFSNGKERIAKIGVVTPSETGYYIQNEANETVIVGRDSIDILLGLLTNPPYAPTDTPATPVTETPLPSATPEVVSTGTATPVP